MREVGDCQGPTPARDGRRYGPLGWFLPPVATKLTQSPWFWKPE
jgi:hypothetical protein